MAADENVDRLSRQLTRYSPGPVDTLINDFIAQLGALASSLTASLRQSAHDQPLTTLLLSYQFGYFVARLGRRRASR